MRDSDILTVNLTVVSLELAWTLVIRNLLCRCGVERTREVPKAVKHSGYARLG